MLQSIVISKTKFIIIANMSVNQDDCGRTKDPGTSCGMCKMLTCSGEPSKQVVFKSFEYDLELVLLPGEVRLELLEIGSLHGHHLGQQLVLQTVSRDGEVDESCLRLHLWLVVRVCELVENTNVG